MVDGSATLCLELGEQQLKWERMVTSPAFIMGVKKCLGWARLRCDCDHIAEEVPMVAAAW